MTNPDDRVSSSICRFRPLFLCVEENRAGQAIDHRGRLATSNQSRVQGHGVDHTRHVTPSLYAKLNTRTGQLQSRGRQLHTQTTEEALGAHR